MTYQMIWSQLQFADIFICSFFMAILFYRIKDTGKLRILMIWAFVALALNFGAQGFYYLLWDLNKVRYNEVALRAFSHLPLALLMPRLAWYSVFKK
jgi:hypothetical protein